MRIDFERSGGFAGIRLRSSVDTMQLTPAEAASFERMVQESGFFNLPERIESVSPGADRFEYRLTISSPENTRTVVLNEADVPERLHPLLDRLADLARDK